MRKFKIYFTKFRNGQTSYERSVSLEGLELLLIVCSNISVTQNKRTSGNILFTFPSGEFNTSAAARNIPLWILKKFAPEKEWTMQYVPKGKKSAPFTYADRERLQRMFQWEQPAHY